MSEQERRRFQRIEFDVRVELSQHGLHWFADLKDISLKGLLLAGSLPHDFDSMAPILVKVILSDQTVIAMNTAVAHQSEQGIGLSCLSIDVESIRHLRRLIELNLGDALEAERELAELIHA